MNALIRSRADHGSGFALQRGLLGFACPNERKPGHPTGHRCSTSAPCAAPAQCGPLETRRAARDSDIRSSLSLGASAARCCAPRDRNTARARRNRSCNKPIDATRVSGPCRTMGGPVCIPVSLVRRRRDGASAGIRRIAPVRPACLSIAKAIQVLSVFRRRFVLEWTGETGAVPGVICWVPSLGPAKEGRRMSVPNQSSTGSVAQIIGGQRRGFAFGKIAPPVLFGHAWGCAQPQPESPGEQASGGRPAKPTPLHRRTPSIACVARCLSLQPKGH